MTVEKPVTLCRVNKEICDMYLAETGPSMACFTRRVYPCSTDRQETQEAASPIEAGNSALGYSALSVE